MARSGGPQNLGGGIETMIPILPRATLEDGTVRAIRSLLHREMTGKITPRSAQMAMERLVPKLEPVKVLPTVRVEDIPTPTSVQQYRQAMRRIRARDTTRTHAEGWTPPSKLAPAERPRRASARRCQSPLLALPQQRQQPLQLDVEMRLDPGDALEVADVDRHAVQLVDDERGAGGVLDAVLQPIAGRQCPKTPWWP